MTGMHINEKVIKDGIYENACFRLFFLTNAKFCTSDIPIKKSSYHQYLIGQQKFRYLTHAFILQVPQ